MIEATSAYEALEAIGDTSSSIDVALLDFRLPDCTDLRLIEEVRRRVPGSAVVLMTRTEHRRWCKARALALSAQAARRALNDGLPRRGQRPGARETSL